MPPESSQVGSPALPRSLASRVAFYLGIVVYAVSFLLPAVAPDFQGRLVGWACAWLAFFVLGVGDALSKLAFAGALINPLALVYIVLRLLNRLPRVRIGLAITILLCIVLTEISLVSMHYGIRIGNVVWIIGLLLVISWSDFRRRPSS